jgi:hypothetical protein
VEDLFQIRDRLLRVEHSGSSSRLISWWIWRNQEEGWQFQQESTNEQSFSTFPSDFVPLRLVAEGDQSEFSNRITTGIFLKLWIGTELLQND